MTTIKGFENYAVDEEGNIISLPKRTRKGIRILKSQICKTGYIMVDLCKEGKVFKFLVHRLIAQTLLPNLQNKPQVNHKNGIKTDNRIENLEWSTRSENQKHSIATGLRSAKGEKNSQCVLKESDVIEIRLNNNLSYTKLAKLYNISLSTIYDIKKGRSWKHI
jgi:DNA-binding transcriptional regulator YiaG